MNEIQWPLDPNTKNAATTSTTKTVLIKTLTALTEPTKEHESIVDSKMVTKAQELIDKIQEMSNEDWIHNYMYLLEEHAMIMASSSPAISIDMCQRGLNKLNAIMTTKGCDDDNYSAKDAFSLRVEGVLEEDAFEGLTKIGVGDAIAMENFGLVAPKEKDNKDFKKVLQGNDMKNQIKEWVDYGSIEPTCLSSGSDIADIEDISCLVENKVFVLLGGTAALGPISTLLKIKGATVVVIARPGDKIQRLIERVEQEAVESVKVLFPSRKDSNDLDKKVIGADLISDAPEIAHWVTGLYPEKQLVLCCLAYLDGSKHVSVSVGMDLICEYVCEKRKDSALSYLCTPSLSYLVPASAVEHAKKTSENIIQLWHVPDTTPKPQPANLPNYYLHNNFIKFQGPNYALAKMSQQWRAMLAHSKGYVVSANYGPPARTASMISHSHVAALLDGLVNFPALLAFDVPPCNSLMAALLLWDLNFKEKSTAHSYDKLDHPMCLFIENAAHGGSWRCPYSQESIAPMAHIIGMFSDGSDMEDVEKSVAAKN